MSGTLEGSDEDQPRRAIVPEPAAVGDDRVTLLLPRDTSAQARAAIPAPLPSAPGQVEDFRDRPTIPTSS